MLIPSQHLEVIPTLCTLCTTLQPLVPLAERFSGSSFAVTGHQKVLTSRLENHQYRLPFQSLALPDYARILSASSPPCFFMAPGCLGSISTVTFLSFTLICYKGFVTSFYIESCRQACFGAQCKWNGCWA